MDSILGEDGVQNDEAIAGLEELKDYVARNRALTWIREHRDLALEGTDAGATPERP